MLDLAIYTLTAAAMLLHVNCALYAAHTVRPHDRDRAKELVQQAHVRLGLYGLLFVLGVVGRIEGIS